MTTKWDFFSFTQSQRYHHFKIGFEKDSHTDKILGIDL